MWEEAGDHRVAARLAGRPVILETVHAAIARAGTAVRKCRHGATRATGERVTAQPKVGGARADSRHKASGLRLPHWLNCGARESNASRSDYRRPSCASKVPSARNMKDRVSLLWVFLQRLNGLCRRQHDQLNAAVLGLTLHILHHWQPAICPGPDNQAGTFPGDVLFQRQGRMSKLAELLRRFLLPLLDLTPIDEGRRECQAGAIMAASAQ